MKKRIFLIIAVSIIVILVIRLYNWKNRISLPLFEIKTIEGRVLSKRDIAGSKICFLYVEKINALVKSTINDLMRERSRSQIFILNKELKSGIPYSLPKDIHFVEKRSLYKIISQVATHSFKNWILVYNPASQLEISLPIKGKYKRRIVGSVRESDNPIIRGNLLPIYSRIKEYITNNPNNIYFFTEQLNSSCICFDTYRKLEAFALNKGKKLKLVLFGMWEKYEIENLIKERDHNIEIEKANGYLELVYKKWKEETKRNDFNWGGIKLDDRVELFPLLDTQDIITWANFKENFIINTRKE